MHFCYRRWLNWAESLSCTCKSFEPSCQGGNGSSGSGSSASRKPIRINGATSLYSLRSLSKEDEKFGVKFEKRPRVAVQNKRIVRGASLENEYSEFDERDDVDDGDPDDVDNVGVVARMRKSDLQEDSDGLWGDDEDEDFRK